MSEKVLLVDDEPEFTSALSERMEARGLDVDIADTGAVALEKIKGRTYDAVILDLSMPELDGLETMKRLLEENPELQVIFLTGRATVEKGVEAMKLGAVDFMEKPADLQELLEKIKAAKSKRIGLAARRAEQKIKDIMRSKGW